MPSIFGEEVHVESSNFHFEDLFQMTKISVKVLTSLGHRNLMHFVTTTMLMWTIANVHCLGGRGKNTSSNSGFGGLTIFWDSSKPN